MSLSHELKFLAEVWSPAFGRQGAGNGEIVGSFTSGRLKAGLPAALLLGGILLATLPEAQAHLPKPIEVQSTVLAVDTDTHTLVFKWSRDKKPFLLDWNKKTVFMKDGHDVCPDTLKPGTPAVIQYRDVSFHPPLLTRVSWSSQS